MLAAEMGADVIKVEPPGGDEMRQWPPSSTARVSTLWLQPRQAQHRDRFQDQ